MSPQVLVDLNCIFKPGEQNSGQEISPAVTNNIKVTAECLNEN
jgi:hypothetical protein